MHGQTCAADGCILAEDAVVHQQSEELHSLAAFDIFVGISKGFVVVSFSGAGVAGLPD